MVSRHARAASCCMTLVLVAAPALGGGSGTDEWTTLDREIAALAQSAQATEAPAGLRVSAVLRANYAWFEESPDPNIEDYSGFALDNVRPRFNGELGDFSFEVELEAQSGTALVLDAYASWDFAESFALSMGRFQPALLRSALVDPENLLFILRTAPGQFFQERDEGAELAARLGPVLLRGSLENGADGAGDQNAYTLRADWDVRNSVRLVEGAYGSGRETCLAFGVGYHDDETAEDGGEVLAADGVLTLGWFSLAGEWLDFGDDEATYDTFADTSPWSATASYMIDPERYEIALRYEMLDDVNDVSVWTVGLNRYIAGHDVKWVLNAASVQSDKSDADGMVVGLGLTVNI